MVSIKKARINDYWRKAYSRNYPFKIVSISFQGGEFFRDLRLHLNAGINAIVGKNGTGKSNFIRTVFNSLSSDESNRKKFSKTLDNGEVSVVYSKIDQTEKNLEKDIFRAENFVCHIYDPCSLIPEIQHLFTSQDNISELLEGFDASDIDQEDLRLVNYLTSSNYEKVKITNIEDEFVSFPIVPFFEVEQNGVRYDSTTMGMGELSLLYFYWLYDYIKRSSSNCFLIVEEPESFIPPLTQERMCNIFAAISSESAANILISTHSEHILKRIPRSHIHVMGKVAGRPIFHPDSNRIEKLKVLGLNSPKIGLIAYEDKAALALIKSLLRVSTRFVTDSFHFHCSGSEGEIVKDLARFPRGLQGFVFLGLFDGDCRARKAELGLESTPSKILLPGSVSPEELLLNFLDDIPAEEVVSNLNISTAAWSSALDAAAGTDHHDYFYDIADMLDISWNSVFSLLCDCWVDHESNAQAVEDFLRQLDAAC